MLESLLDEIFARVDRLPVLDPRTPDEILDYDENGLPR
jgi:TPP-dependent indolepyruvate ferredoxin oxidoreductase alpha subunit